MINRIQRPSNRKVLTALKDCDPPPITYDREHVIVLSDHSFMHPHTVFKRVKQEARLVPQSAHEPGDFGMPI